MTNNRIRKSIIFACVFSAIVIGGRSYAMNSPVRIVANVSESIPGSVFLWREKTEPPKRGDLVQIVLRENKFFGDTVFGKKVLGVPGDQVTVRERVVYINGVEVGFAKPLSKSGVELFVIEEGVIPESSYYLGGVDQHSYDSRYASIGLVKGHQITGTLKVIF